MPFSFSLGFGFFCFGLGFFVVFFLVLFLLSPDLILCLFYYTHELSLSINHSIKYEGKTTVIQEGGCRIRLLEAKNGVRTGLPF